MNIFEVACQVVEAIRYAPGSLLDVHDRKTEVMVRLHIIDEDGVANNMSVT